MDQSRVKQELKVLKRGKFLKISLLLFILSVIMLIVGVITDTSWLILSFFAILFPNMIVAFIGVGYFLKRQSELQNIIVKEYWIPYLNSIGIHDNITYQFNDPAFDNNDFDSQLNLSKATRDVRFTITTDETTISLLHYSRLTGSNTRVTDFSGVVIITPLQVNANELDKLLSQNLKHYKVMKTNDDKTIITLEDMKWTFVKTSLKETKLTKINNKLQLLNMLIVQIKG